MKHRILALFIIFSAPFILNAQGGFGLPPGFDLKTFQKNEEMAMWFIKYDSMVTFVSSFDRNMAGKDFICFEDKKGWKVVAGKIDSTGIKNASWFSVDAKNVVTAMKKKGDTVLVHSMARALFNGGKQHAKLNLKFSAWKKYIRQNADLTFTVTMFCDKDASGNIWYGPECMWWFSADGNNLVTTKVANKAPVSAGVNGKIITLSCPTEKMPTLGTMWLAYRIMNQFPEINISYKTGTSTLNYNAAEKTYSWHHEGK